jgi:hypothetical protein
MSDRMQSVHFQKGNELEKRKGTTQRRLTLFFRPLRDLDGLRP